MAAQIFTDGTFQGIGNDGKVVPYGKLYVKNHYTGLLSVTYQDSSSTVPNTNPVILTASGKGNVFLPYGVYDIELRDATDVIVWTLNNFIATTFDTAATLDAAQTIAIDTSRAEAAALQAEASALTAAAYANIQWGSFYLSDGDLVVSYVNGATSIPSLVDGDFIITY